MKNNTDVRIGCLSAIACEALFGFSYLFTKNATAQQANCRCWDGVFHCCDCDGHLRGNRDYKNQYKGEEVKTSAIGGAFQSGDLFLRRNVWDQHTTVSESGALLACIPVASLIASSLILKKTTEDTSCRYTYYTRRCVDYSFCGWNKNQSVPDRICRIVYSGSFLCTL